MLQSYLLLSAWMKEEHQRKLDLTNEKRVYWESKIATAVEEIEKFKLDEHILQKAVAKDSDVILSFEELQELRENHATTNMVQLNSKLNSAKNEEYEKVITQTFTHL